MGDVLPVLKSVEIAMIPKKPFCSILLREVVHRL